MSRLLDFLNALDTNASLIQTHKSDPLKAARDFGLSDDEQLVMTTRDKQQIAAFLDIPFRDFDAIDSVETYFGPAVKKEATDADLEVVA
ncbi:hypothetical protein ACO0LC_11915 [Undibacterium sp. JH2W]|uniref:hypothetical protein n=1 Tax=Undibacterium sp. JH2W TaxID=3413037 RepID=UPI003BF049AC